MALALVAGQQSWTSVYVGALLAGGFGAALAYSFRRLPGEEEPFQFGDRWSGVFVGTQLASGSGPCWPACTRPPATSTGRSRWRSVSRSKTACTSSGAGAINAHYSNPEQRYALDLGKLHACRMCAAGLFPSDLSSYAIYGGTLHSPCRGQVGEAVSDVPEYAPPKRGDGHPGGNRVVLRCKGARVFLGHILPGSIVVDRGEVVPAGASVGCVGNSGNTTEPHLHLHATRDGRGVPLVFEGCFLVRNSLVWR